MEGSFAANNTSTINTSNDQRLLIGNIIDEGGGIDNSNTKNNHRRSPMRAWNQLSRLQRNLLYLLFIILAFACFWNITRLKSHPKNLNGSKDESSLLSNVDQLINNRIKEIDDERVIHPDIKESGDKNHVDKLEDDKNPRNRIQAVHNVVKNGDGVNEFDANYNVDQNEDQAKENDDEDFENQEDKSKKDNEEEYKEGVHDGQDSNQADENFRESYEQDDGNRLNEDDEDSFSLPPKDGSLKFKGPQNERQTKVVEAFKHAWTNYRSYAWGHDHLRPISKSAQNWFGLGLTLIDSLDTMFIMNLKEEFKEARDWVENSLNFEKDKDVNLFETTIRVLGGLLSTYHLSSDDIFLEKAKDLGTRLMGSFTSPSGIPYSDLHLKSSKGHAPKWSPDSSTSEVTTLQLEFLDLSRCTKDPSFEKATSGISKKVHDLQKNQGLVPIFINPNTGKFRKGATVTLGARGDSYYEYLLKQWIQTGKTTNYLKEDFVESVIGMANLMAKRTEPNGLLFLGELLSNGRDFKPKMDELVCFLPGTLALAAHHGLKVSGTLPPKLQTINGRMETSSSNEQLLLQMAEELAYTCYLTFARQPTFLAAEITYFNEAGGFKSGSGKGSDDFYVKPNDSHYLLRPETIESLWYLYYVTGNKTYQDWGWKIFQGIEKYTKVKNGYTTISNVKNTLDLRPKDMMESFFLGETLKYLYLLFADKHEINLKEWVFNTEAHPLPIYPN